ncbi:hypothetical protein EBR96_01465 [bacterium]|nr:hypothetical protein [bacterium]
MFIGKVTIPDYITAGALACALTSCYLFSQGHFGLGFIAGLSAMMCDAHDGYWARRLKMNSPIGPVLDSLTDVIAYLMSPVIYWISAGFDHWIYLIAYLILISTGIYRLSVFTTNGFEGVNNGSGHLYYRGLPVFWVPFVAMSLHLLALFNLHWVRIGLTPIILVLSFLMIYDKPRYKPTNIIGVSMFLLALIAIWIGIEFASNWSDLSPYTPLAKPTTSGS